MGGGGGGGGGGCPALALDSSKTKITRPTYWTTDANLYPPERQLTKASEPSFDLEGGSKVKSGNIRRFPAHVILQVDFTLPTSRINNKPVISTFKFGCPHLTMKEGPKVKSDHTRRFPAHDFLHVGFTLKASRTNNN